MAIDQFHHKIAIVVCALPPNGGGIGNNAFYQARHLARAGFGVEVFTPAYKKIERLTDQSFIIKYLPVFLPWGKAGFMFSLRQELENFSLVHLYLPFFGSDLLVGWFKKFHPQTKLVLHYQMDPVGQGFFKLIFKIYLKLFLPFLIKAADKIGVLSFDHAQSSYLKKYLKKQPAKFAALPNGIDLNIFKPGPVRADLKEQLGFKDSDQVIIFVGGLDRQHYFKGVEILLSAFAQIYQSNPGAKLLIVGEGSLKKLYQAFAKKIGVAESVKFTGWVANENLPDYYRLAQVFVLPSTAATESFGIVAAEAQACGLPAVVSDWPGVRTTIINNQTGFLTSPGNSLALAQKISGLLNNSDLRQKFGAAAQVWAKEFGWERIIKEIIKIYDELV